MDNSERVTTENRQFKCVECENTITVPEDKQVGDFFECEFCGLEYKIISAEGNEFIVEVVEEEK
jgi:DNA-directed RNA polymerase subunit RPC12/RpoP